LIGLNTGRSQIAIAVLGDAKPMMVPPRGIFSDIQAYPRHQWSRVSKTGDIPDFRNPRQRKDMFDSLVTGQGLHRFFIAWCLSQALNCLIIVRVRYGTGASPASLLLMVYTPTQHHNLMAEPFSGKIARATAWGYDEPCVFGQGVTQNKAHHAVVLAVLKLLIEQCVPLQGTLYVAVNNGRTQ
jgi:hypothetical protein